MTDAQDAARYLADEYTVTVDVALIDGETALLARTAEPYSADLPSRYRDYRVYAIQRVGHPNNRGERPDLTVTREPVNATRPATRQRSKPMSPNSPFTIADLFITQSQLALDDPKGPYTAGSPSEIIAWAMDQVIAATKRNDGAGRPPHVVVEFKDHSAVAVIQLEDEGAMLAKLSQLRNPESWSEEDPAWVHIGGQPGAAGYLDKLAYLMADAPHPSDIILSPVGHPFDRWADTMLATRNTNTGQTAAEAAQRTWEEMQRHADRSARQRPRNQKA